MRRWRGNAVVWFAAVWLALGALASSPWPVAATAGSAAAGDDGAEVSRCTQLLAPILNGAKALEQHLAQCEAQLSPLRKAAKACDESGALAGNELAELRARARRLEDDAASSSSKASTAFKRAASCERNATQLALLAQAYRVKNGALKSEVERALGLVEYEQSASSELSASLGEARASLAAEQAALAELRASPVQARAEAGERRAGELEEEAAALRRELAAAEARAEQAELSLGAAQAALETGRQELVASRDELAVREQLALELGATNARLEERGSQLSAELRSARARLDELGSQHLSAEQRIARLASEQERARAESELLQRQLATYKDKVDDPAIMDFFLKKAEWLQHPRFAGVDEALDKTMQLLRNPKLQPTHRALLEMQALLSASSQRLSSAVADRDRFGPWLSGFLSYGILLVPLAITLALLVRMQRCLSLSKLAMLMTLYNAIFCAVMIGGSLLLPWLRPAGVRAEAGEAMAAFREQNLGAFEFLQIVLPLYFAFYLGCQLLMALKFSLAARCRCSLRVLAMLAGPLAVLVHYYLHVWLLAMRDEPPRQPVLAWGAYSAVFFVEFFLLTCSPPASAGGGGSGGGGGSSSSSSSNSSSKNCRTGPANPGESDDEGRFRPLLEGHAKAAGEDGVSVEAAQLAFAEAAQSAVLDLGADVMSPEEVQERASELVGGGRKKKKKSSRRAHSSDVENPESKDE
jgi:hypothetical protein